MQKVDVVEFQFGHQFHKLGLWTFKQYPKEEINNEIIAGTKVLFLC